MRRYLSAISIVKAFNRVFQKHVYCFSRGNEGTMLCDWGLVLIYNSRSASTN